MDAGHITPSPQLHGVSTAATTALVDIEHHLLMYRDERAPADGSTTFRGEFWDTADDDWLQSATLTSDDDDDVNVRLPWFQSYSDQPLQLTPPTDTGSSSHSDDSPVSRHRFRSATAKR